MTKKKAVYARYAGTGYVYGVPAMDMSKKEWMALPAERRKFALDAGTHKITKKPIESAEEVNDG